MSEPIVKDIITDIEALGEWSIEIDPKKEGPLCQEIILNLKATMREKGLVSLTAPQIGYNKKIMCIKFGKDDYRTMINPMIDHVSNIQFAREKCSSIPDKEFIRPRFATIRVLYVTPLGAYESRMVNGLSAYVIQHCIDHLEGLLLSDVGLEIDELWDQASEDERTEVLKAYAESLDIKLKNLQTEISHDKDLSQLNDAINFIASVKSGETQLEHPEN